MGRRPIGERALTNAEKQRKYRQIRSAKKTKGAKIKDKEWYRASRNAIKNDPEQYKEYKRKERGASGKETKKAAENAGPDLVNMKFPAFSRSLNKVKNSLPKKHTQKRAVVKALFEQTINLTPKKRRILSNWAKIKHTDFSAKGRKTLLSEDIKEKIDKFLCRSDISYTLPGRNKQVYLGKIEGVSHGKRVKNIMRKPRVRQQVQKLQIFLLNNVPIFEFIITESVHKLQSTLGRLKSLKKERL